MSSTPYPFLFRLLHGVMAVCLAVLMFTGLSLHAIARPDWSLLDGRLPSFFWPGRILVIHLTVACVLLPSLLAIVWLYSRRNTRRKLTHVFLLGGGLVSILSAVVLLESTGGTGIYPSARLIHAVMGLVVLPISLLGHACFGLTKYRGLLVSAFHLWCQPRWQQIALFVPLAVATTFLILNGLPPQHMGRQLVAQRIDNTNRSLESLPWNTAEPLSVELANGTGFDAGRTRVSLRALHDGRDLYVLAEWLDPIEDRQYQPWEKTQDGWRQQLTSKDDETVYYEDKFAFAFPIESDLMFEQFGCATSCHASSHYSYGYKATNREIDVWHWKAVRTDPVDQADDKYWSEADFENKNVGRHGDPRTGGGYTKNTSEDGTHPAFLPDGLSAEKQGGLLRSGAVDYTKESGESMSDGTNVPGIVVEAFQGDRGDVQARSYYTNGRWQLYLRRRLDTDSPHDVTFVPGQSHAFACAAFDHCSNRHAYGLNPYWLTLER